MASFKLTSFLSLLVILLPTTALGDLDDLAPALSPFFGTSISIFITHPFNFSCECEAGWKKTMDNDEHDNQAFLPCIIPECTLNYNNCQTAPPPAPDKEVPHNISVFDPCSWIYCGEGTCKNTSNYKHTCECNAGFQNLLNVSYFPCFSGCALGADCGKLGIKSSNAQTNSSDDSQGSATSFLPGKFHWMTLLIMPMVIAIWK